MKNKQASAIERPPIVVIMGHIDHGKSTLVDYIRKTNVTAGEAGGITQHTSAYEASVSTSSGTKRITFIDTPGHAAFSAMRKRGAKIADIAVLVVSAVEGVQVQTLEALRAIEEAKIPYIVAINKMDKPEADEDRAKQSLAQHGIYVETYGGSVPSAPVSAKTGKGVPELLDLILLVSDLQELRATEGGEAEGYVVESHHDSKRGSSATLVIKNGTLTRGEFLIIEGAMTPIRILEDVVGKPLKEATFSTPVIIAGLVALPMAGSLFSTKENKKEAEAFAEEQRESMQLAAKVRERVRADDPRPAVPLLIKADTLGTLEALEQEVTKLIEQYKEKLNIQIIHSGVGTIGEGDLKALSGTERTIVVGFNVKIDRGALEIAERMKIEPKAFSIIYEIEKYLADECAARVPSSLNEEVIGGAKILRVFSQKKDKQVVGGLVTGGVMREPGGVKIFRQGHEIARGAVLELQQQKARKQEVESGNHFGALIESKMTIAEGDTLEIVNAL